MNITAKMRNWFKNWRRFCRRPFNTAALILRTFSSAFAEIKRWRQVQGIFSQCPARRACTHQCVSVRAHRCERRVNKGSSKVHKCRLRRLSAACLVQTESRSQSVGVSSLHLPLSILHPTPPRHPVSRTLCLNLSPPLTQLTLRSFLFPFVCHFLFLFVSPYTTDWSVNSRGIHKVTWGGGIVGVRPSGYLTFFSEMLS